MLIPLLPLDQSATDRSISIGQSQDYDEGEEEAVGEFEGGADQPDRDDEEAQEQEPDPVALEDEQEYPGDELREDDEEEEEDGYYYGAG